MSRQCIYSEEPEQERIPWAVLTAKGDSTRGEGDSKPDFHPYKHRDQRDGQDADKLESTFPDAGTNAQGQCF